MLGACSLRSRRRTCFSENRYPARIKSGPGFFGIMLELIRQSTALVARRRVDRSHQGAPVLPGATSPTAEAMRSECIQSEFESPVAHHFCFFARVAQWRRREAYTLDSPSSNLGAGTPQRYRI